MVRKFKYQSTQPWRCKTTNEKLSLYLRKARSTPDKKRRSINVWVLSCTASPKMHIRHLRKIKFLKKCVQMFSELKHRKMLFGTSVNLQNNIKQFYRIAFSAHPLLCCILSIWDFMMFVPIINVWFDSFYLFVCLYYIRYILLLLFLVLFTPRRSRVEG